MPAYSHACNSGPTGGIEDSTAIVQDEIVAFTAGQAGEIVVKLTVEDSRSLCVIVLLHSRAVEDCHFLGISWVNVRFTSARDRWPGWELRVYIYIHIYSTV